MVSFPAPRYLDKQKTAQEVFVKKAILIMAILLLTATGSLAADKTIVAAADPWPPFIDPSAPQKGLALEIVRAAFGTQGYTVDMKYVPWANAVNSVKEGKYDILPNTWVTEERKAYLHFSEPYAVNEVKFIKLKDDSFEFNGLDSIAGKKVGTVRGYAYGDDFNNATNFTREDANDFLTNIKKLTHAQKRIDLTLEDEIVARALITKEDPTLLEKISFTKNALSSNSLHVTCSLKNPKHKEIIEAFNTGLADIKASGEYAKILEKYGIR
jgi:polar amino acid transport system substrate-binding protein